MIFSLPYGQYFGFLSFTASWEQNHPTPIWWKNYTNSLGWIFIYLWVVRVCGFNIGIGFPSYLKDISWFVRPKMRLYKLAIFTPQKWLFGNSDTTFTLTEFSRLHFVQISRNNSSAPNWAKSRVVDFGYRQFVRNLLFLMLICAPITLYH